MIKVIKQGELKEKEKENTYAITCICCNAIFTCQDSDFTSECWGHGCYDLKICCPICMRPVYFDDKKHKKMIRKGLTNRF